MRRWDSWRPSTGGQGAHHFPQVCVVFHLWMRTPSSGMARAFRVRTPTFFLWKFTSSFMEAHLFNVFSRLKRKKNAMIATTNDPPFALQFANAPSLPVKPQVQTHPPGAKHALHSQGRGCRGGPCLFCGLHTRRPQPLPRSQPSPLPAAPSTTLGAWTPPPSHTLCGHLLSASPTFASTHPLAFSLALGLGLSVGRCQNLIISPLLSSTLGHPITHSNRLR